MTERRRAYFYRIATAVVGLLVVYGLLDGEQAGAFAILAAAVLGAAEGGLASLNTSTKKVGDEVGPLLPATVVQDDYVRRAVDHLTRSGYTTEVAERSVYTHLAGGELDKREANCIRTLEAVGIRPLEGG